MRVALATDHAGFPLKARIAQWLTDNGHEVVDFGVDSDAVPVDYPDYVAPAARAVAAGDCERGIVLGGSGTGEAIVANKIHGIRAVEAADPVTARLGREHNDANVLVLPARLLTDAEGREILKTWLDTPFEGGRHERRVEKIEVEPEKK